MKKAILLTVYFAVAYMVMLTFSGCHINNNSTDIAIKETPETYQLKALFSKNKTGKVRAYMDQQLNSNANIPFANAEIDATITLNDASKLYVKSHPGILEIKFNKTENSEQALAKVKNMCQGLKAVINE